MASYERLADLAFAAALDVKRYEPNQHTPTDAFRAFVKLLQEPIHSEGTYKLLDDARNLPVYRSAWSTVFDNANDVKKTSFIKRLSDFLNGTISRMDENRAIESAKIAEFLLALNNSFLEENASKITSSYNSRMSHAIS